MPPHDDQLPERLRRRVAEDVRRISETRVTFRAHLQELQLLLRDLRVQNVYRLRVVVEGRRPEYNERRTQYAGYREQEQEDSIQHHRYVLPVILHLENNICQDNANREVVKRQLSTYTFKLILIFDMLCNKSRTFYCLFHLSNVRFF